MYFTTDSMQNMQVFKTTYLFHLTNPDPGVSTGSEQNSPVFYCHRCPCFGWNNGLLEYVINQEKQFTKKVCM